MCTVYLGNKKLGILQSLLLGGIIENQSSDFVMQPGSKATLALLLFLVVLYYTFTLALLVLHDEIRILFFDDPPEQEKWCSKRP